MSFHMAAFVGVAGTTDFAELTPAPCKGESGGDGMLFVRPGTKAFWSDEENFVLGAFAGGVSPVASRLCAPRQLPRFIRPLSNAIQPPSFPNVAEWRENPVVLPPLQPLTAESMAVSAQTHVMVLWLTRGLWARPAGEIITIRANYVNQAANITAFQWSELTNTTFPWDFALPAGRYAVVGSEHSATTCIAHRWVFSDTGLRPGALSMLSVVGNPHRWSIRGELGSWGTFESPVMPRLEVFSSGADNTHKVYLHVVRLEAG